MVKDPETQQSGAIVLKERGVSKETASIMGLVGSSCVACHNTPVLSSEELLDHSQQIRVRAVHVDLVAKFLCNLRDYLVRTLGAFGVDAKVMKHHKLSARS